MALQTNNLLRIPEKVETERLILSRFRHEDAEEIFYTYASKAECTKFVSWPTHQTINDTREYLNQTTLGWKQGVDYSFAVRKKVNNRLIGGCGFLLDNGKAQVGYVFGSLHWGNGLATEVTRKLIELLKDQTSLLRIGSFIDSENLASARVLKKVGMVEEACLKNWFQFPNQGNVFKDCILFKMPD